MIAGLVMGHAQAMTGQAIGFLVIDRLHLSPAEALPPTGLVLIMGAGAALLAQWGLIPLLNLDARRLVLAGLVATLWGREPARMVVPALGWRARLRASVLDPFLDFTRRPLWLAILLFIARLRHVVRTRSHSSLLIVDGVFVVGLRVHPAPVQALDMRSKCGKRREARAGREEG